MTEPCVAVWETDAVLETAVILETDKHQVAVQSLCYFLYC